MLFLLTSLKLSSWTDLQLIGIAIIQMSPTTLKYGSHKRRPTAFNIIDRKADRKTSKLHQRTTVTMKRFNLELDGMKSQRGPREHRREDKHPQSSQRDVEKTDSGDHGGSRQPERPESSAPPYLLQGAQTFRLQEQVEDFRGWRVWLVRLGLWASLFLSTMETTIVSTSLISITDALDGFMLRDWIVTAYLLTYTGCLTIMAKLSDIFGRKTMLLYSIGLYTLFSMMCGLSVNIIQLITFRAIEGIGASGIQAMIMLIGPGLVPNDKYNKAMTMIQTVTVVASTLGPILGGVINSNTTWQWVFFLNIPAGVISFALIAWLLPTSETSKQSGLWQNIRRKLTLTSLRRIDMVGSFLLLASCTLFIFSLQMGGSRYEWNDPIIITTLILAILLFAAFVSYELYLELHLRSCEDDVHKLEPLFPPTITKKRLISTCLGTAFCIGFPFVAVVVNIPQRAQTVSGLSPFRAGLQLLPMMLTSPFATALAAYLTSGLEVPPFYLIVSSSVLQLLGVGLMCSLPRDSTENPPSQYGFQVLMGIGFGLMIPTLMNIAKAVISQNYTCRQPLSDTIYKTLIITPYQAPMIGALIQVRVIAGTISVAICSTILNNFLDDNLRYILTPDEAAGVLASSDTIRDLDPERQLAVKLLFARGYYRQYLFLLALTALGFLFSLCTWETRPREESNKLTAVDTIDGAAGV